MIHTLITMDGRSAPSALPTKAMSDHEILEETIMKTLSVSIESKTKTESKTRQIYLS